MTSHDEELDQYIDAINAGRYPDIDTDDPELLDLYRTVDRLQVLRQPDWPPESFASEMAAQLSTTLAVKPNGHVHQDGMGGDVEASRANPWIQSETDVPRLEAFPLPPKSRLRRGLQVSGALVAFAAFALVLVLVFQGMSGDGNGGAFGAGTPAIHQLAYSANSEHPDPERVGPPKVYLVNADGSDLSALADGAFPSWSPDGSRIAYTGLDGSSGALHVMNADGTDQRRLTDSDIDEIRPAWSPDGERIAFVRTTTIEDRDAFSLWLIDADGTNERMLADGEGISFPIAWSPDGSRIAFDRKVDDVHHIELVTVTTGEVQTLTESEKQHSWLTWSPNGWLTWSPDGNWIASIRDTADHPGLTRIHLIDVRTGEVTQLPATPGAQISPAWSPDGSTLAFAGQFDDMEAIYTVNVNDPENTLRPVHTEANTGFSFPTWSPDSRQLAFIRNPRIEVDSDENQTTFQSTYQLAILDLAESDLTVVVDNLPLWPLGPPAWGPTSSSAPVEPPPTVEMPVQTAVPVEPTVTPITSDATPVAPQVPPTASSVPQPESMSETSISPSRIWLETPIQSMEGQYGSYSLVDEVERSAIDVLIPVIPVGTSALVVQPGGEDVRVTLTEDAEQPERIVVSIYSWHDNSAAPVDPNGNAIPGA